jgi:UDP-N-acetylmuramate: L-alanyl-gamma-D-glutamyl-meso-diaminopimelate ligase
MSDVSSTRRVHFSGIGGTAMVAGARLALEAGWEVRGSDNPLYPPTSHMVEALDVPVATGFAAANLDWNPDYVIVGNVLSRGNPEVEAALERGLRYVSLPEWLKEFVLRPRRPVVIAGTHGKTTTTAITAHLLTQLGMDPGYLIGGQPISLAHSARLGPVGAPFVIEGDEYDTAFFDKRAKFFHYLPRIAVVTSVEFDHGDIYKNLEEIELAFERMLRQIPRNGHLILCADQPHAADLAGHAFCNTITYGFNANAQWRLELEDSNRLLVKHEQETFVLDVPVHVLPGRHNAQNIGAATMVAHLHGASSADINAALQSFGGVKRRMEVFHEYHGAIFVDDFAHHPTAIRETIAAARLRWPQRRLIVAFEPRSNTTVTRRFQSELVEAFHTADELFLGPIHRADSIPDAERLDRKDLAEALTARGCPTHAAPDVDAIVNALEPLLSPDTLILILSNGAFGSIYEKIRTRYA